MLCCRVLLALFALQLLTACTLDPEAAKRRHLERGQAYFKQQKYAEAVIEFANAVRIDPQFGEGRLRLADAHVASGNVKAAFPEFVRAADLMPASTEAQIKAANVLIRGGFFVDARNRLRPILQKDPRHVQALMLLGQALGGIRNVDDALGIVERLIEVDPERGGVYTNLGVLTLAKGDFTEAEAAFKKAVDVTKRAPEALVGLGNFYRAVRRYEDAKHVLTEAYAAEPKSVRVNDALASLHVEMNRPAEAEPYLKAIVQLTSDPAARYALASYYVAVQRFPDALGVLHELAEDRSQYVRATTRIAMLEFLQGNRKQAHQRVDEALKRQKNDAELLTAKARLLLADDRIADALPFAKGALVANPDFPQAHLTLGRIQVALRTLDDARRSLNDALRLDPNSLPAQMELADLHFRRREIDTAVQFASQAAGAHKESLAAQLMLVRILSRRSEDHPRAEKELKGLLARFPESAAVQNAAGALLLAQRQYDRATAAFERALALDPSSYEAVSGLVSIDMGAGRPAEARARIDAMLARQPREPAPLMLAATIFTLNGESARAEELLKRALLADPSNPSAYNLLAQLYVEQNRIPEAMRSFEEVARLQPDSTAAPTMLGLLAFIQRQPHEAQRWWERALQIDSTAAAAANNLAWLYAQQKTNLEVALQLAQTARAKYPDLPEVNDTLGWVYHRKGLSATAVNYFAQSIEAAPDNPTYHFHLGLAYAEQGEDGKARKALERALAINPKFEGAAQARETLTTLVF